MSLCSWLARKALNVLAQPDYSLKGGDLVTSPNWPHGPILVLDINWALLAAAVRLNPNSDSGCIVWPVWNLRKTT